MNEGVKICSSVGPQNQNCETLVVLKVQCAISAPYPDDCVAVYKVQGNQPTNGLLITVSASTRFLRSGNDDNDVKVYK